MYDKTVPQIPPIQGARPQHYHNDWQCTYVVCVDIVLGGQRHYHFPCHMGLAVLCPPFVARPSPCFSCNLVGSGLARACAPVPCWVRGKWASLFEPPLSLSAQRVCLACFVGLVGSSPSSPTPLLSRSGQGQVDPPLYYTPKLDPEPARLPAFSRSYLIWKFILR